MLSLARAAEQLDAPYEEVKEVRTAPRAWGSWGDMVVVLKDNSKIEIRSLDRCDCFLGLGCSWTYGKPDVRVHATAGMGCRCDAAPAGGWWCVYAGPGGGGHNMRPDRPCAHARQAHGGDRERTPAYNTSANRIKKHGLPPATALPALYA